MISTSSHDARGKPTMVGFNGVGCRYMHTLQGDIAAIVDGSGNTVVEYTYDAWGKPLTKTGTLAATLGTLNPLRYRGYVFDEETGLYYLRSRYYNPNWNRFVKADTLFGDIGCLLTHNAYTYCKNRVILYSDHSGYSPNSVISCIAIGISIIQFLKLVFTSVSAEIQLRLNAYTAIYRDKKELANRWKQRQERSSLTGVLSMLISQVVDSEADKYIWFKNMVNHRAPWDYKVNKPWWALTSRIYFDGEFISFEDYGNINYGYVGTALGMPEDILIAGSVYAHYTAYKNFDDSETDHYYIRKGISHYQN